MTMIHINLLPVRQVKKQQMGIQLIALGGVLIAASVVGNFLWWQARQSVADANAARIQQTQKRIAELDKVLSEVSDINKRRNEVQDKLKHLDELRRGRSGPVRMMDALSVAMPKKVWLNSFIEHQEKADVHGNAYSHEDVAEFMKGLDAVVWTPRGLGRLIEQKRDGKTARVELLTGDDAIQDFPVADVKNFFTNIVLKDDEEGGLAANGVDHVVAFDISFDTHYAI